MAPFSSLKRAKATCNAASNNSRDNRARRGRPHAPARPGAEEEERVRQSRLLWAWRGQEAEVLVREREEKQGVILKCETDNNDDALPPRPLSTFFFFKKKTPNTSRPGPFGTLPAGSPAAAARARTAAGRRVPPLAAGRRRRQRRQQTDRKSNSSLPRSSSSPASSCSSLVVAPRPRARREL